MNRSLVGVLGLLLAVALAAIPLLRSGGPAAPGAGPATAPAQQAHSLVVKNVRVYDLEGRLAYQGDVDLRPVLERIEQGGRDPHRNDGSVHRNRERRLPARDDPAYYREYVVRTPGLRSVGPQRLVVGKGGEVYYTPDHYDSFVRVR